MRDSMSQKKGRMRPTIHAIFFDLGDTLIQINDAALIEVCKNIGQIRGKELNLHEYKIAWTNEWKKRSTLSDVGLITDVKTEISEYTYWESFIRCLLPTLGITLEQPEITALLIDIYTNPQSLVCFDDTHRVLSELKARGLILGIISNAFPSTNRILDYLDLRQYFQHILLSFELSCAKPELQIYRLAAKRAQLPIDEILFVDDRWTFVKAAQEANMNAWLIDRSFSDGTKLVTQSLVKKIKGLMELIELIDHPESKAVNSFQE